MNRTFLLSLLLLTSCARSAEVDTAKLKVPAGFRVATFATLDASPRFMAFSPGGVLLVTATSDGRVIALPDTNKDGRSDRLVNVLSDLAAPHGIAFYEGKLYIAVTDAVVRYDWDEAQLRAGNPKQLVKLPRGGMHFTRSIAFANGKMYVSAGSNCNVCDDEYGRAAVQEFNPDGTGGRLFARGLRNSVGMDVSPVTGTVWAADNGRDWLGDELPPDEVNDLGKSGGDFGWPYCYGKRVPDLKHSGESTRRCPSTVPAKFDLPAHSAALGMA
ncbi:MAG TPA: PQQ-dependent sugar dehydrogenase, partial [Terriglobales bacterium]|nr:PQQ-dependent sugar dehydrogenase [Terriglobales bacterium]